MNDKYIQAIIIGALIGGSIIVAELISQPKRNNMKLHTVELQKDIKDNKELEEMREMLEDLEDETKKIREIQKNSDLISVIMIQLKKINS